MKITFIGDIMCQKEQTNALSMAQLPYEYQFRKIKHLFQDSDYVIGNLETPLAGKEQKYTTSDTCFNTCIDFAHALKNIGVNFVSTANNHCMDRGVFGLDKTLESLDLIGIDHSGTYSNKSDSNVVFVKNFKGRKIAIVTGTYGQNSEGGMPRLPEDELWRVDIFRNPPLNPIIKKINPYEKMRQFLYRIVPFRLRAAVSSFLHPYNRLKSTEFSYICDNVSQEYGDCESSSRLEKVLDKIMWARQNCDFVIAYPHVGGQYNPAPGKYTKFIVKSLVEAGADIVVANHPHTSLRYEEFINGVKAFYSLGNFCFTPGIGWFMKNMFSEYSIVLNILLSSIDHMIDGITFSVIKNVVRENGISELVPVSVLAEELCENNDASERLLIENEAVVNRFAGWAKTIPILSEYRLV